MGRLIGSMQGTLNWEHGGRGGGVSLSQKSIAIEADCIRKKAIAVCFVFGMFQVHVVESSSIADHCRTYTLNDSTDPDFQACCRRPHNESCQCCQLQEVLTTLESAL